MQHTIRYASITLLGLGMASAADVAHADEGEGGIGIGYLGRIYGQVSVADVSPGRDEMGELQATEYDSSTPIKLGADFATMILPSVNDNKHGFEGSMSVTFLPFDFDMWGGTALTMLAIGDGGIGTLRVRGGFGMGASYNHGYFYLRGRAAAVIVPKMVSVEASYFWIPNEVSYAWGEQKGDFEEHRQRASVYVDLGEDSWRFEVYAERTDRQRGGHDKDYDLPREDFTMRDPDDDLRGIGLGGSLLLAFD